MKKNIFLLVFVLLLVGGAFDDFNTGEEEKAIKELNSKIFNSKKENVKKIEITGDHGLIVLQKNASSNNKPILVLIASLKSPGFL